MEKELGKTEIDRFVAENGKNLDHYRMLREIADMVENDFCADMDSRFATSGEVKFTNEEAKEMAHMLGKIYSIAHCITCRACQGKYENPKNNHS